MRPIALTIIACQTVLPAYAVKAPAWWASREVLLPAAAADDYALANVGQLKFMAAKAAEELNETYAPQGGAGTAITAMIAAWPNETTPDDFNAANLGQLKHVAAKFYVRLSEMNYVGPPLADGQLYPWTDTGTPPDDYALANLGQLKLLFSFAPVSVPAGLVAPAEVHLTFEDFTAPTVRWRDNNTLESGYRVEKYRTNHGYWTALVTLPPGTTYWSDPGFSIAEGFSYRVVVFSNALETAEPSEVATFDDGDLDGLPDVLELGGDYAGVPGTYPTDPDQYSTNGSGVPDLWFIIHNFDPLTHDSNLSTDADLLTDAEEYEAGTDPRRADTDGDGLDDHQEIRGGLDPLDPGDVDQDLDGDGISNRAEILAGTPANDYYNAIVPVFTSLLGPQGALGIGDTFSVLVTDEHGTPLINAPVEFNVANGRSRIRPTPTLNVYWRTLTARTGTDGIATVYVVAPNY